VAEIKRKGRDATLVATSCMLPAAKRREIPCRMGSPLYVLEMNTSTVEGVAPEAEREERTGTTS